MNRLLHNRRILITGASSGIGRHLAELLGQQGARLALASRSEDKLKEVARSLSGDTLIVPADVTNSEDRRRLYDKVVERFGGLDVLINNAGIGSWGHFSESTEEIMRQIMEVNFFAPAELMRLAVPVLTEGDQPAIVNVASMCGRRAMPAWSEVLGQQIRLVRLDRSAAGRVRPFNMDVLLVVPGLTNTDYSKHLLRSEGRMKIDFTRGMPPEDVAAGIVPACRGTERNRPRRRCSLDAADEQVFSQAAGLLDRSQGQEAL